MSIKVRQISKKASPKLGSSKSKAVGRGYNVITSQYIVPWEIKCDYSIIDTSKLDNLIKKISSNASQEDYVEGTSAVSFVENLNVKVKASAKFGAFSAEASVGFDHKSKEDKKMIFVQCRSTVHTNREYFEGDTYKNYLSTQFKADLNSNTISPQTLFTRYGTHLIKGMLLNNVISLNSGVLY